MFFCTDCGSIFEEQHDICPECGFNLEQKQKIDDYVADNILRGLREKLDEFDRLIEIRKKRIESEKESIKELEERKQDKIDRVSDYLKEFMKELIAQNKAKGTKTQYSYKLVEGNIAYTKPKKEIQKGEFNLEDSRLSAYKRIKEELDWAKLKKELTIEDDELFIDGQPFQVEGFEVIDVPSEIKIKFEKKDGN